MSFDAIMDLVLPSTLETLYMVVLSALLAVVIGLPLAILLFVIREDGLNPISGLYRVLDVIINILRSFPFIILMIVVLPLSSLLVGTKIGTTAAIVPLTISAFPFITRLFEQEFTNVPKGLIDAAKSMGSTNGEIVRKVLIPESMPGIIAHVTNLMIMLVGYSAMAGTIGGGGLGNLAIRYGYYRREEFVLWIAVLVIVIIVQLMQWIGTKISTSINKK
ncbi:MAG: ABC transporter permease [Gallicola sp.]|uniref:methionine ABC transporter permease n=1 Tax=Gallicola sp. Sow4_E12 TaxID=3438785 RepID=UPI00184E3E3A|nr:ABC transporter permease [Gallicola sp.]